MSIQYTVLEVPRSLLLAEALESIHEAQKQQHYIGQAYAWTVYLGILAVMLTVLVPVFLVKSSAWTIGYVQCLIMCTAVGIAVFSRMVDNIISLSEVKGGCSVRRVIRDERKNRVLRAAQTRDDLIRCREQVFAHFEKGEDFLFLRSRELYHERVYRYVAQLIIIEVMLDGAPIGSFGAQEDASR